LQCLDEAMLAATGDELSPVVTGLVYCDAIAACQQTHAMERARMDDGAQWLVRGAAATRAVRRHLSDSPLGDHAARRRVDRGVRGGPPRLDPAVARAGPGRRACGGPGRRSSTLS